MSVGQLGKSGFAEVQRRKAYLAPLFTYLLDHYYVAGRVAAAAGEREHAESGREYKVTGVRLALLKRGELMVPPWLVEQCCAVIGKSVEEVMGAEWVKRYGPDGWGGEETAPTGTPRMYPRAYPKLVEPPDSNNPNNSNGSNAA